MADSVGLNRNTGQPLEDFAHVQQSLSVLFTTRITSRVLRRNFGSAVPGLLGHPMTQPQVMRFYLALVLAVELWEPRFLVTSIHFPKPENSATRLGQGQFGVTIGGLYRPRALHGDFTVTRAVSVLL